MRTKKNRGGYTFAHQQLHKKPCNGTQCRLNGEEFWGSTAQQCSAAR